MTSKLDVARLERSVKWALANSVPHRELVCMLRPLVRATQPHSEQGSRARLHLAEHLLLTSNAQDTAWEVALLTRAVLGVTKDPEQQRRAWGAQGLACTLLGQYRTARAAYRRALAIDPSDPICAHNLGHLEVCKLNGVQRGIRWLRVAHAALPADREVAASLAHALHRRGDLAEAKRVLGRVFKDEVEVEQYLARWERSA